MLESQLLAKLGGNASACQHYLKWLRKYHPEHITDSEAFGEPMYVYTEALYTTAVTSQWSPFLRNRVRAGHAFHECASIRRRFS